MEIFFPRHLVAWFEPSLDNKVIFQVQNSAGLLPGNKSSCKNREPPSKTGVLVTSRDPENFSLTYSTFQCDMRNWKPVYRCIFFEFNKNLRCVSLSLTQHGFQHRILSVIFSFIGMKIQYRPCSLCLLCSRKSLSHEQGNSVAVPVGELGCGGKSCSLFGSVLC